MFKPILHVMLLCLSCNIVAMQNPQKKDNAGAAKTIAEELKSSQKQPDESTKLLAKNDKQEQTSSTSSSVEPSVEATATLALATGLAIVVDRQDSPTPCCSCFGGGFDNDGGDDYADGGEDW